MHIYRCFEKWLGEEFLHVLETQCSIDEAYLTRLSKSLQAALQVERDNVGEVDANDEVASEETELPAHARYCLDKFISCLKYLTMDHKRHAESYRVCLVRKDQVETQQDFDFTFSIWALSSSVAIQSLVNDGHVRSLILSSGTLSPLDSFDQELGVSFKQRLEAPHVVDVKKNLWAGVVGFGVNNVALQSTYRHQNSVAYQDELGNTLLSFLPAIPHGKTLLT